VVTILLSRGGKFKLYGIIILIASVISFTMFHLIATKVPYKEAHSWMILAIVFNGATTISLYSVVFEYAVELTPGVGEAMSGAIINSLTNVLGFV